MSHLISQVRVERVDKKVLQLKYAIRAERLNSPLGLEQDAQRSLWLDGIRLRHRGYLPARFDDVSYQRLETRWQKVADNGSAVL